jgi:hypothetical protein
MGKQRIFILPFPLPKEAAVLGRLVLNPGHPHQDFIDPASLPSQPKPEILSSDIDNFSSFVKSSKRTGLEASLTTFASVLFSSGEKSLERLAASKATEYLVSNSGSWYQRLCAEKEVRLWMETAFNQESKVYLITGYRTLVDTKLHQQETTSTNVSGRVTVPVAQIGGIPSDALDLGARGGHQSNESADRVFTAPNEKIFAVQYRRIKINWYSRKDVQSSFLEKNNRWVEMFTMRSGTGSIGDDTIYEAVIADEEDEDIPDKCEVSDLSEDSYVFFKTE